MYIHNIHTYVCMQVRMLTMAATQAFQPTRQGLKSLTPAVEHVFVGSFNYLYTRSPRNSPLSRCHPRALAGAKNPSIHTTNLTCLTVVFLEKPESASKSDILNLLFANISRFVLSLAFRASQDHYPASIKLRQPRSAERSGNCKGSKDFARCCEWFHIKSKRQRASRGKRKLVMSDCIRSLQSPACNPALAFEAVLFAPPACPGESKVVSTYS